MAAISTPSGLDKSLRTIAVMYFFMYAAIGIYFTYIAVYFRGAGLSGTQIGLINMTAGIVSFFGSTLWGYLCDRTGRPQWLMAVAAAGAGGIALLIPLGKTFPYFLAIGAVYALFNAAINTLMDSTTLSLLGEKRSEYGRYRVGGTFGYIVTTLTVGFLFERVGLEWMFPAYGLIMALFVLAALRLPHRMVQTTRANRSAGAILNMIRQPGWLVFALTVFIIWFAGSGAISFVGITLRGMGANDVLIGWVSCSAAVFEIPFMAFNHILLRKLGSRNMLWFSTIGYILRITAYSLIPSPAWGIAANALNGISYAFMWNSSINYANENAPDHLKATAQGLFVSTTALAGVASSITCGWLFDTLGPVGMFRTLAAVCFSATLVFGIWGRKQPARSPASAVEAQANL